MSIIELYVPRVPIHTPNVTTNISGTPSYQAFICIVAGRDQKLEQIEIVTK